MNLIWFYLTLTFNTVGVLILCGLVVTVLQHLFVFLIGHSLGYRAILMTAIIGTPIHELGHAGMCLLFGHKIEELSLYNPNPQNGMLGYVRHSYQKKNPYHQLGNFLIGLGPIFSGVLVITAILFLCFRGAISEFFTAAFATVDAGGNVFDIAPDAFAFVGELFVGEGHWLVKTIGFLLILSVMLHVNLSAADIRNSAVGFALYAVLLFVFATVVFATGKENVLAVSNAMQIFCSYCFVVFAVIFVFSAMIVALAAVLYLIRQWLARK